MKILYVPNSMARFVEYIDRGQVVINPKCHDYLIEDQARLFNFLYKGCEDLKQSMLPTLNPVELFRVMFQGIDDPTVLIETAKPHAVLIALNIAEKGEVLPLDVLYGELDDPETKFVWEYKEKRESEQTNKKFFVVSLVPALPSQIERSFVLSDEGKAKKMFCAEYFKKLRTTTRVSDGTNDTVTSLFTENPVLTALYACHLL